MMNIDNHILASFEDPYNTQDQDYIETESEREEEEEEYTQQSTIVLENILVKPKRRVFSLTEKKRIVNEARQASCVAAGNNNFVDPRNVRQWKKAFDELNDNYEPKAEWQSGTTVRRSSGFLELAKKSPSLKKSTIIEKTF
jgi:hypothetical protein